MSQELDSLLQTDHYSSLTGELKCACGTYLEPPIKLCTRGHGSCKICRRKYQRCATCKEEFTETRSVALEALAAKLKFPCKHAGCSVHVELGELNDHESTCLWRITPCYMNKIYGGCGWKGTASDWLAHCVENHKDRVTDLPFVSFSEPWSPKRKDPIMRLHLLRCFDTVFSAYQIYENKSGKMMWTVIMIERNENKDQKFYFDLEIYNPNDETRKLSYRQLCKSDSDADILDVTQAVMISIDQILYMLDEKKHIHFNLRINEITS